VKIQALPHYRNGMNPNPSPISNQRVSNKFNVTTLFWGPKYSFGAALGVEVLSPSFPDKSLALCTSVTMGISDKPVKLVKSDELNVVIVGLRPLVRVAVNVTTVAVTRLLFQENVAGANVKMPLEKMRWQPVVAGYADTGTF
jgi:hypothetical protein